MLSKCKVNTSKIWKFADGYKIKGHDCPLQTTPLAIHDPSQASRHHTATELEMLLLTYQCRLPNVVPNLILHILPSFVYRTTVNTFKGSVNLKLPFLSSSWTLNCRVTKGFNNITICDFLEGYCLSRKQKCVWLCDTEHWHVPFCYSKNPVQSTESQSSQRRTKKLKQKAFFLRGLREDLWICGPQLARMYHKFNYILAFGITLKGYGGTVTLSNKTSQVKIRFSHEGT
jgi:hypothetical protein